MKRKYQQPDVVLIAYDTQYGVMDDVAFSKSTEGNPPEIHAKDHSYWPSQAWDDDTNEQNCIDDELI